MIYMVYGIFIVINSFINMDIQNFNQTDAFDEANKGDAGAQLTLIHIRLQQRSGRKTLTTVQGKSVHVLNLNLLDLRIFFIFLFYLTLTRHSMTLLG